MARSGYYIVIVFLLAVARTSRAAINVKYEIDENINVGEFVGNLAADSGILANLSVSDKQSLRFDFVASTHTYSTLFSIKPKTGIIQTAKDIDREKLCSNRRVCQLPLRVSMLSQPGDRFHILRVIIIVKDANDNSPIFRPNRTTVKIPESSETGDRFELPLATDSDIGINSIVSYAIVSGNRLNTFKLTFVKIGNSITGLNLVLNKLVDREKFDRYTLDVMALDGGSPPNHDILVVNVVVVDVNDQPPKFVAFPKEVSVAESFPKGDTVLTVSATDSDTGHGGKIVYSLEFSVDFDASSVFQIDSTTGVITTKVNLDYEQKQSYMFRVIARDTAPQPLSAVADVKVIVSDVNDNKPAITLNTKNRDDVVEIAETAKPRSFIVHVSVFDADSKSNGEVNCTIDSKLFILELVEDKDFKILLNTKLNREERDSYQIQMTCMDRGAAPKSTSKVITVKVADVNDNRPHFRRKEYAVAIKENNKPFVVILTIHADDLDSGANGEITYSLSSNGSKYFEINSRNGDISPKMSFDRERPGETEIRFEVVASDGGVPSFSDTASVIVTVLDENDVEPRFDESKYEFNVTEGSSQEIVIGQISASDDDSGDNGVVMYSLRPSRHASKFRISLNDGVLKTRKIFDREKQDIYTFEVLATDRGIPSRQSSAVVTVKIDDVNDNKPVIRLPRNGTIEILNSFPTDGVLLRVNAYDIDIGRNGEITYGIKNSTFGDKFDINEMTGVIKLTSTLDERYDIGTHSLVISVEDNGEPPLNTESVLTVVVSADKRTRPSDTSGVTDDTEQTNLIIIVVIVSVSTLISITLVGAIYIIHSRQKLDRLKNTRPISSLAENVEIGGGTYSERSYSSEASTTSTECDAAREMVSSSDRIMTASSVNRLFPHCDSPNIVISGNVKQYTTDENNKSCPQFKTPRTSSPLSLAAPDDRVTNRDANVTGNGGDVSRYDDTIELRRSLRNVTQQRYISELTKKSTPYSKYMIHGDSGTLLT